MSSRHAPVVSGRRPLAPLHRTSSRLRPRAHAQRVLRDATRRNDDDDDDDDDTPDDTQDVNDDINNNNDDDDDDDDDDDGEVVSE